MRVRWVAKGAPTPPPLGLLSSSHLHAPLHATPLYTCRCTKAPQINAGPRGCLPHNGHVTPGNRLPPPPPSRVHYLWFAFVCFLINEVSPPPPQQMWGDWHQVGGFRRWATLLQACVQYLPYTTHPHPAFHMARSLSHVNTWYMAITPPVPVVYFVSRVCLYLVDALSQQDWCTRTFYTSSGREKVCPRVSGCGEASQLNHNHLCQSSLCKLWPGQTLCSCTPSLLRSLVLFGAMQKDVSSWFRCLNSIQCTHRTEVDCRGSLITMMPQTVSNVFRGLAIGCPSSDGGTCGT